jgi:hypothetical protein
LVDTDSDVVNLVGQLSSWSKDETLDVGRILKHLKCGDKKSGSFTGSGLSLDDAVFFCQDGRNANFLDVGWLLIAISINSSNKFILEFEILKGIVNLLYTLLSLI